MLDKTIGFALCGSFCTYAKAMAALNKLTNIYAKVIPIFPRIVGKPTLALGRLTGTFVKRKTFAVFPPCTLSLRWNPSAPRSFWTPWSWPPALAIP